MKLILINKLYPPPMGGVESHVQLFGRKFKAVNTDWSVEIIAGKNKIGNGELLHENGVLIKRMSTLAYVSSTPIIPELQNYLMRSDADIFHFHSPYPWAEFLVNRTELNSPIIVTYHFDVTRQKWALPFYKPILNSFLEKSQRIIVSSKYLANSENLVNHRNKVDIIPLGIDTSRFRATQNIKNKADYLRSSLSNFDAILLFVGRFVYYKGLQYLIKSVKKIPCVLLLVGDGPLQSALEALSKEEGISEKVKFITNVSNDDLPIYYHASDIFLFPSVEQTEAYGLVQLEAHASGLPVINTELGTGVNFVNQDGYTGLTVQPRNIEALSTAIMTLVKNTSLRQSLGRQAQRRAVNEFDITKTVMRMTEIYKQIKQ